MLTHIGKNNMPKMVDVNAKSSTHREAVAESIICLPQEVLKHLVGDELMLKKGPVFQTAIIAGTMAVKKTSELIPFCHPLPIEACDFRIEFNAKKQVRIECKVSCYHKTGIEMEALCGVTVAALTVYDMCKALSQDIQILDTQLISKSGGKSDFKKK